MQAEGIREGVDGDGALRQLSGVGGVQYIYIYRTGGSASALSRFLFYFVYKGFQTKMPRRREAVRGAHL